MKPNETHDENGISHKLMAVGISVTILGGNFVPIVEGVRAAIKYVSSLKDAPIQNAETPKEKNSIEK